MRTTMQNYPLTVAAILNHGATVHGSSIVAVANDHGASRTRRFDEIADLAGRLAAGLRSIGVRPGDRVATVQWNNLEHLIAYFAVPAMGAILHTVNFRLAVEDVSYIFGHAEDTVVIVDADLVEVLVPVLPHTPEIEFVVVNGTVDQAGHEALSANGRTVLSFDDLIAHAGEVAWPVVDEDAAAAVCYTSGTTGRPKGVVYSHRSVYLHALSTTTVAALGIGPQDVVLGVVPMFHANGWGLAHACFLSGAGLALPDRRTDAATLVSFARERRVTVSAAVPTIWSDVFGYLEENPAAGMPSLRVIFAGGSAVPESLMRASRRLLGVELIQGSGMTETSPVVTVAHPQGGISADDAAYWTYRRSAGRILAGVEARLVDDAGGVQPRDGISVGEIEYRGAWITGAYHQDATGDSFHDGWLRTGDLGTITPDGYLAIVDRAKDVVKSGGEWISSSALEAHLLAHPAVAEVAVVPMPDERWGERPLACIVPATELSVDELKKHLATLVPRWQVPEYWSVVDALPRTSVGKLDKKLLKERQQCGELAVLRVM
ncbi:fatty acid--CoA ligase [Kribbella sp. NBC_00709]|uniref:fatty acid--CoA ligase n=1 Tax=Kribbella sp. NBC_00709 TaxID=2975972 RepID=UPI002E27CBF6|nr:fatty acid--CoA ligase [Kribbella sp. NBC_00709]